MTRNILGLEGIIVLLGDRKSIVLNIWYIKLHCKSMGLGVMIFWGLGVTSYDFSNTS